MATSNYEEYTSLSGVEIQAVFDTVKFGDLHMIKFATQRDVSNIHVMGRVDAVGTAKGKRQTSGACVFSIFQKDRLMEAVNRSGNNSVFLTNHELENYGRGTKTGKGDKAEFKVNPGRLNNVSTFGENRSFSTFDPDAARSRLNTESIFDFNTFGGESTCLLADQIPQFDITLVGISETTGRMRRMVFHGVQFSSDQGGTSIDDLVLERQMSFLARRITPWGDPDGSPKYGIESNRTAKDRNGVPTPAATGSTQ